MAFSLSLPFSSKIVPLRSRRSASRTPGASARSWAMILSLRDLPDGSSRRSGGGALLDLAFPCSPFSRPSALRA
eukprot:6902369-Pyramimonas_sp.AAC.1